MQGDAALLEVMMTNFLDNAWKFTQNQQKPVIEFGVTTINGERVYFVRDNGAGFDMKYVDKLFMPFQRLHSSIEFAGTPLIDVLQFVSSFSTIPLTLDPDAMALSHPTVISRATGDRQVQVHAGQLLHRQAAVRGQPIV